MKTVVIFLGGNGPHAFPNEIEKSSIVKIIAADSGIELAEQLNIKVDVLIGDLDSADQSAISRAISNDTQVISFDKDKDFTDFELALDEAKKSDAEKTNNYWWWRIAY